MIWECVICFTTQLFLFGIQSQLLPPSSSSLASAPSRAFRSTASLAAVEDGSGCNHSNFPAIVAISTRAGAAPLCPLRYSLSRPGGSLRWDRLLAGAAHFLQTWKRRFNNDLRPQKPSSCHRPLLFSLSSSSSSSSSSSFLRTLACCLSFLSFGWGGPFLVTVLLFLISSFSLLPLQAGDGSEQSLAVDRLLLLLLQAEERVDPKLSLKQQWEMKCEWCTITEFYALRLWLFQIDTIELQTYKSVWLSTRERGAAFRCAHWTESILPFVCLCSFLKQTCGYILI